MVTLMRPGWYLCLSLTDDVVRYFNYHRAGLPGLFVCPYVVIPSLSHFYSLFPFSLSFILLLSTFLSLFYHLFQIVCVQENVRL